MQVLEGHTAAVAAVRYSPDGERLLSASLDGTVRLWDRAAAKTVTVVSDNDGGVRAAAFSPNGRRFATAGDDAMVRVYDTSTGRLETTYAGTYWSMSSIAWSPDGTLLTAASSNRVHGSSVVVWTPYDGRRLAVHPVGNYEIHRLAFTPNGQFIVIAIGDGRLLFWNPTADPPSEVHLAMPRDIAFTMNIARRRAVYGLGFCTAQPWLATGDGKRVAVWQLRSGRMLFDHSAHRGRVNAVEFAPSSTTLASGGADGVVCLWEVGGRAEPRRFDWEIGPIQDIAFAPDGQTAAAAGANGLIVWDADDA